MPKVASKQKQPEGFDLIEPTLQDLEKRMRDAENEPHDGKRRIETTWPIARIHHERSRYIFNMFYREHKISRELYEWCLKMGYADAALIAKWKKQGYEKLCCMQCIEKQSTGTGSTCICRVPRGNLPKDKVVECVNCGCHGCASCD